MRKEKDPGHFSRNSCLFCSDVRYRRSSLARARAGAAVTEALFRDQGEKLKEVTEDKQPEW